MYVCMYVYMYVYMHIRHACMHAYIYIYVCMHVCMYACMNGLCTYWNLLNKDQPKSSDPLCSAEVSTTNFPNEIFNGLIFWGSPYLRKSAPDNSQDLGQSLGQTMQELNINLQT